MILSVAISFLYTFGLYATGYHLVKFSNFNYKLFPKIKFFIEFFLGISVVSITLIILSSLNILTTDFINFFSLILFVMIIPLVKKIVQKTRNNYTFNLKSNSYSIFFIINIVILIIILLYVFSYCFSNYSGADLGIYHLPYTRDILYNEGLFKNPNLYSAGTNLGWQVIGTIPFYWGGQDAYLGLNFWIFLIFILFLFFLFKEIYSIHKYEDILFIINIMTSTIIFLINNSLPNNDLILTFLGFFLVFYTIYINNIECNKKNFLNYSLLALFSGLLLSIKLTLAPLVLVLFIYNFIKTNYKFHICLSFFIFFLPFVLFWPLYYLDITGNLLSGPLASLDFTNTNNVLKLADKDLQHIHSNWTISNIFSMSINLIFLIPLLISLLFNLKKIVLSINLRVFLLISLSSYLIFIAIKNDYAFLFHNRYHLVSIMIIVLISSYSFFLDTQKNKYLIFDFNKNIINYSILFLLILGFFSPQIMNFPDGEDYKKTIIKPIFFQIFENFSNINNQNLDEMTSYIIQNTPKKSIIATQSMNIYKYDRNNIIQINPLSANTVDLNSSPDEILISLKKLKVNFLHFNPRPGLVPGARKLLEKYNNNLNLLKNNNNLLLVKKIKIDEANYEELYRIVY